MLEIRNLHATVDGVPILKGLDLTVRKGEIHAIMGPNGAGKSTLAKVLAGHPAYEITDGGILLDGIDLMELEPEERAHAGLFMGLQYPIEVPGVNNDEFLLAAYNAKRRAHGEVELDSETFLPILSEAMEKLSIRPEFRERALNEGFSGGEKKRNEILQMAVLRPSLAVLDETDSGLDIDAIRIVAEGIKQIFDDTLGLVLITHYQRILNYVTPHYVHAMVGGRIVQSGPPSLAAELESRGYDWLTTGAACTRGGSC